MSRRKVWTASQPPSSDTGGKRTAAAARVWVRPQTKTSAGAAEARAAVGLPGSLAQRPAEGPGKACLAAVLATAAAKPHSQPAVGSPEQGSSDGVLQPSPRELVSAGRPDVQAASARPHGPAGASALAGTALARQPRAAAQPSYVAAGVQVPCSSRPASKTWIRPDGAQPPPAAQYPRQAARSPAALDSLLLPAPPVPGGEAAGGDPRPVSSRSLASKTWVRPESAWARSTGAALPAAPVLQKPASPVVEARQSGAGTALQLPKLGPPDKRVWRRDESAEVNSTALAADHAGTTAAAHRRGQTSRTSRATSVTNVSRSHLVPCALHKQTDGTVRSLRIGSADMVPRRPRSLTWQNPDLCSATQPPSKPTATAPAAGTTAVMETSTAATAANPTAATLNRNGIRLPVSPVTESSRLPGARAAALGRTAQGRVSKQRSIKLQRIGEHLYREQRGAGGRTLQRQGATPTAPTRSTRQVSSGSIMYVSRSEWASVTYADYNAA